MKVVFVSGMLPSGHYSQYLTSGIAQHPEVELLVYADKNQANEAIRGCGVIKRVWSKSLWYIFEIVREIRKDRPNVVHLQHELNMYGGIATASVFPFLIILLRLVGYRVVTTVHAAVYKRQVNVEFMQLFHRDSRWMKPFMLRTFFHYIYKTISLFSSALIVHTHLAKDILVADYGVDQAKIHIIPIAIPSRYDYATPQEKYFFYFGYMVRRKGIGFALEGFRQFLAEHPTSEFKLVLAGGVIKGQEAAFGEIEAMIKMYNLIDRVIVRGFIEEAEQHDLYRKAYAVVIPAVVSMGSSGPLFHANSYGKCVICSDIGHFKEDVINGRTGILVENHQWSQAFAQAATHPELVNEIEKHVIEKAKKRDPLETARQTIKVYRLTNLNI